MKPTHPDIEVLLDQCRSGNQRAQMKVYNRYYKAMYNASFRIVKDSFKAEDIMQESFLIAFTKLETLRESSMFGSWLKRIVINNSIVEYHKNNKCITIPLEDVIYKVEDDQSNSENNEWTNLKAAQILQAMHSLKENYRIVLTLFLIEGYDYKEIGEILNISYGNSRTLVSRAKENLREKLTPVNGF